MQHIVSKFVYLKDSYASENSINFVDRTDKLNNYKVIQINVQTYKQFDLQ